jgi:hypothetical protein
MGPQTFRFQNSAHNTHRIRHNDRLEVMRKERSGKKEGEEERRGDEMR